MARKGAVNCRKSFGENFSIGDYPQKGVVSLGRWVAAEFFQLFLATMYILGEGICFGSRATGQLARREPRPPIFVSPLHDQHRVAVAVEAVLLFDRFVIRLADEVGAAEGFD